jgi:DNA-binding GntR family transcriptional regulator
MHLAPLTTFSSKKEAVYASLRTAIFQGEFQPGERLVIDTLAKTLGVSAIPVREALQLLQADGLVDIKPHVGASVTTINPDMIYEVFKLLEATEVISSRAACERMSASDLAKLERLICSMDDMQDDPERWSAENVRLHQFICERSRTHLAGEVMTKTLDQWNRIRRYYLDEVFASRLARAQKQHWAILEALKLRDIDRVEQVIQQHNQTALADYQILLSKVSQP